MFHVSEPDQSTQTPSVTAPLSDRHGPANDTTRFSHQTESVTHAHRAELRSEISQEPLPIRAAFAGSIGTAAQPTSSAAAPRRAGDLHQTLTPNRKSMVLQRLNAKRGVGSAGARRPVNAPAAAVATRQRSPARPATATQGLTMTELWSV